MEAFQRSLFSFRFSLISPFSVVPVVVCSPYVKLTSTHLTSPARLTHSAQSSFLFDAGSHHQYVSPREQLPSAHFSLSATVCVHLSLSAVPRLPLNARLSPPFWRIKICVCTVVNFQSFVLRPSKENYSASIISVFILLHTHIMLL